MLAVKDTDTYRDEVIITPEQIRAARMLLGWKQIDLAQHSGLSEIAIKNIEQHRSDPRSSTLGAILKAFDDAGVVFLLPGDARGGGAGVRFK